MSLLSSSTTIGIDIQPTSLRVAGIQKGKNPRFIGCKEMVLPPNSLERKGLVDPKQVADVLRQALQAAAPKGIKGKEVVICIPEMFLFRKVIELAAGTSEAELLGAIQIEVSQYLPESLENMQVDYQLLGSLEDGKIQQFMVVATHKTLVDSYLQFCSMAHLVPSAIIPVPSALAAAIQLPKESGRVILDLEDEMTTVCLYDQGIVRVTSAVNVGGTALTGASSATALKDIVQTICEEIDHVVKFYANRTINQDPISEVLVTGKASMQDNVCKTISEQSEYKVSPAKSAITTPPFCDRRFLGSLGCALSSVKKQG